MLPLSISHDIPLVGGKAASLARLMQARFNVPAGFVVTTAAQNLNDELKRDILSAFDNLGTKYVAVRSSAVAEDGAKDAWAGQMDTFLNVNKDGLVEAIQKCWNSAGSSRAKAYAQQRDLRTGRLAVVVQEMVHGSVSGVAFSVHPVTKNNNHLVIEAVRGLADSLVSGTATPDNYIIDKQSHKTIEKTFKETNSLLDEKQLNELSNTIIKLETYFGFAVDVEWTYANDRLFILQSRPITTLG